MTRYYLHSSGSSDVVFLGGSIYTNYIGMSANVLVIVPCQYTPYPGSRLRIPSPFTSLRAQYRLVLMGSSCGGATTQKRATALKGLCGRIQTESPSARFSADPEQHRASIPPHYVDTTSSLGPGKFCLHFVREERQRLLPCTAPYLFCEHHAIQSPVHVCLYRIVFMMH